MFVISFQWESHQNVEGVCCTSFNYYHFVSWSCNPTKCRKNWLTDIVLGCNRLFYNTLLVFKAIPLMVLSIMVTIGLDNWTLLNWTKSFTISFALCIVRKLVEGHSYLDIQVTKQNGNNVLLWHKISLCKDHITSSSCNITELHPCDQVLGNISHLPCMVCLL